MSEHQNPFLVPYNTPHDTVPFDKIRLEDYEEAFMEGIRRDNEQIDKIINNPEKPTFDNTIVTISPMTLVNGSFCNWKGMQQGAGRRVTRVVYIDFRSIHFMDEDKTTTNLGA